MSGQSLHGCASKSCAEYNKLKDDITRETDEKMSQISDLMTKDFRKWKVLADKIIEEKHRKMSVRYQCIIDKCKEELKKQIQDDIDSQKTYIKYISDSKEHSTKPSLIKQSEASIKKAHKDLENLERLLKATKLEPKDVENQLRLL